MHDDKSARSQQLQQDDPHLPQDDLHITSGKENELLERVDERLNKNREEVIDIIANGRMDQG